jgi:hypothetical protein
MKFFKKNAYSIEGVIIFSVVTMIFFICITLLTAKLLYLKGGLDYYGYPLTFYIDYHNKADLNYKSTNIMPIREEVLSNASIIFNFLIDLLLVGFFALVIHFLNKYILKRLIANLVRFPAYYFGLTYLILIPLYAIIYFLMPNQFYKNTFNIEKISVGYETTKNIQYEITDEIVDILAKNFVSYYKCNYIISDKGDTIQNPISSGSMEDYVVTTDGSNLIVPIFILSTIIKSTYYNKIMNLKIQLGNLNYENSLNEDIFRACSLELSNPEDTMRFDFDINRIFPLQHYYNVKTKYGEPNPMHISIPRKLYKKINSFVYGVNGYSFQDDFWSLFYLSTVTITTLGFGDIVPITRTCRLLVSSEAILGIILIGLFLNALTRDKIFNKNP